MAAPTDELIGVAEAFDAVLARTQEHHDPSTGEGSGVVFLLEQFGLSPDELDGAIESRVDLFKAMAEAIGHDGPPFHGFLAGVLWQKARERA